MRRELLGHKLAYLVLLVGVMIFTTLFMGAWPNKLIQRIIIVALMFFYFFWGVLTHFKTKTITSQVVYEYGGVAFLGGLLLMLITL
jgi:hypothetical protein